MPDKLGSPGGLFSRPGPHPAPDSIGLAAVAIALRPRGMRSGLPLQLDLVIGEHDRGPEMRSGGSMAAARIDEVDNPLPEFDGIRPADVGHPNTCPKRRDVLFRRPENPQSNKWLHANGWS